MRHFPLADISAKAGGITHGPVTRRFINCLPIAEFEQGQHEKGKTRDRGNRIRIFAEQSCDSEIQSAARGERKEEIDRNRERLVPSADRGQRCVNLARCENGGQREQRRQHTQWRYSVRIGRKP